jgi:uncharacterized protein (TIRG00374 family)
MLRQVQPHRVVAALAAVDPRWLALAVAAVAPAYLATVWRWRILLQPSRRVSLWRAGRLVALAYLLNLLFPARPGDVLRAYLVGRPSGPPFGAALTTIVAEKALDGVAVATMTLLLLSQLSGPGWLRHGVLAAAAIFALLLLAAVVLANAGRQPAALAAPIRRWPALARRLDRALTSVQAGARVFGRPGPTIAVLGLTACVWAATLATAYALAAAFSLGAPTALPALALGAATLGLAVPAAPGGVGPYQVLVMAVLTPAGVPPAIALSYGLALQFCQILPLAALGALAGAREWGQAGLPATLSGDESPS